MIFDFTTTLTNKKQLTSDVFLFTFTIQTSQKLEFTAGQYLLLKLQDKYRQYSIASPSISHNVFELLVQMVPNGLASTFLTDLAVGQEALFRGPAGVFTLQTARASKVFLATGAGIAPIRSMFHTTFPVSRPAGIDEVKGHLMDLADPPEEPPTYQLFWGVKTCDDMYFEDELRNLQEENKQFDFTACLSRQKSLPEDVVDICRLGRMNDSVAAYIAAHKENLDQLEWYLCGGKEIVDSLKEFITAQGASPQKIIFEKFT